MSSHWFFRGALFVLLIGFLPACGEEVAEEAAVKLPPREHTWVREEAVKKTKEDFFSKEEMARPEIPVDEALAKRLTENKPEKVSGSVTDIDSCLKLLEPLDKKRMQVQKESGAWHAFERSPEVRYFSDQGMQIDSHLNQRMAALRRLCKTAKGIPEDNITRVISKKVAEKGREGVLQEFVELGKEKRNVEIWLQHAEYSKKNEKRDLDYKAIETLIVETEPLLDFYAELAKREVDATTKQAFLSDAVTLLAVITERSSKDEYLALALKEEEATPFENIQVDL